MSPNEQFVDTGYFIALVNACDLLRARARRIASALQRPQVTTEAILIEVADAFAAPPLRSVIVELLPRIRSNPRITVVELSAHCFSERGTYSRCGATRSGA